MPEVADNLAKKPALGGDTRRRSALTRYVKRALWLVLIAAGIAAATSRVATN